MGQPCSVCSHPDREPIDKDLAAGQLSQRAIGARYGLAKSAIGRHKAHGLDMGGVLTLAQAQRMGQKGELLTRGSPGSPSPEFLAQVHAGVSKMLSGATLSQEVSRLRSRADKICVQAEASKDSRTALLAIRELTRLLELQGRMILEASQGRASDVSSHPVWMTLAGLIMGAIAGCETCKPKVLEVIRARLGVGLAVDEIHPKPTKQDVPFP